MQNRTLQLRNDLGRKRKEGGGAYSHISKYMFVNSWMVRSRYSVAILVALIVRPMFS